MCEPCVKGVSTVKTRGMLFNDEMVRAILADQKTQTRRIIKPQYSSDEWSIRPAQTPRHRGHTHDWWLPTGTQPYSALRPCPYGVVGDRITVREAFSLLGNEDACAVDWNDNVVMTGLKQPAFTGRAANSGRGIMGCGRSLMRPTGSLVPKI